MLHDAVSHHGPHSVSAHQQIVLLSGVNTLLQLLLFSLRVPIRDSRVDSGRCTLWSDWLGLIILYVRKLDAPLVEVDLCATLVEVDFEQLGTAKSVQKWSPETRQLGKVLRQKYLSFSLTVLFEPFRPVVLDLDLAVALPVSYIQR
jgi:hypothetical protein